MAYTGITGTTQGASPNFDQGVICGANLDLSGVLPPGQTGNCYTSDGQLWIGSTALSAGGTRAKIGNITSSDGSINVINGSGTIDIRGQAAGFQPNAVIQLFDDFFAQNGTSPGSPGQLMWTDIGSTTTVVDTNADHPGIRQFQSSAQTQGIILDESINGNFGVVGGGQQFFGYVWDLVTLSVVGNRYTAIVGLKDDAIGSVVDGIYFSYSDNVNGGQWVLNCTASSVTTSVNTTVVATTGFNQFGIVVNAAGTSVSFYINNAFVGTAITTHIPSAAICPVFEVVRSSGSTPASQVDLFWYTKVLSNPRPGPVSPSTTGTTGRFLLSYTATAISYQVLGTDAIIGVTSTAAPRTITMPNTSLTVGQIWIIKDETGGAAAQNITISGNGSLIDGAATYVIASNYGSVQLYWNGTGFKVI